MGTKEDKKVLVLLDLNGTVAYRSEAAVRGVPPLLFMRHKNYYPRIGILELIKDLHKAGFAVAVYTSIMKHNVMPFILALVKEHYDKIYKIYDRDFNKPDPDAANEWDTIRDMSKIWTDKKFGPKNTILIDNESRKFQEVPRNGIVVPEYGEAEVRNRVSNTLDTLTKYLLRMSQQPEFGTADFDVRDYMDKLPFDPHASLSELTEKMSKLDMEAEKKKKKNEKTIFQKCLLENDLGGRSVAISEVNGTTIRFFGFGDPAILLKVECKLGLVFKEKMQLALVLSFRDKTSMELHVNGVLQVEDPDTTTVDNKNTSSNNNNNTSNKNASNNASNNNNNNNTSDNNNVSSRNSSGSDIHA